MSSDITRGQIRRQLAVMARCYFDIGILRPDGRMLLREGWTVRQIDQAIQRLKCENARGAHIFVRPNSAHALSLVDDLGVDAIARMTNVGFRPALVVETSPQNFQVWLNHRRTLDRSTSSYAAKELAERFGGDPSSADWRHFGRLAGFTNRKPERLLPNGFAPFVRLCRCEGKVYDQTGAFLKEVKSLAENAVAERLKPIASQLTSSENSVRPLAEFHRNPRYDGDLHRADMAWALHAASRVFQSNASETRYCMPAIYRKKGGFSDGSIMRKEPRLKRSGRSSRSTEPRGYPLLNAPSWGES